MRRIDRFGFEFQPIDRFRQAVNISRPEAFKRGSEDVSRVDGMDKVKNAIQER